jgi:hypothetical protein
VEKQPKERNKYLTAAILIVIAAGFFLWTFSRKW